MIVAYDPILVVASVLIAIMASFTALRLLAGLRHVDASTRKAQIAKAATATGGGIWSMHFVGMLAVRLPVPINYDLLYTLGSVLIAILIAGIGLAMMHMGQRSLAKTAAAGTVIGIGIVCMHYVGMAAIQGNCLVRYAPLGFAIPTVIAIVASTCALALAYKRRTVVQMALGAAVLGVTISGMHYSAMAFTSFEAIANAVPLTRPILPDTHLALVVAVASFLVCGLFLLSTLPVEDRSGLSRAGAVLEAPPPMAAGHAGLLTGGEGEDRIQTARPGEAEATLAGEAQGPLRIPYERNNVTYFLRADDIRAIKADGHYTEIYDGQGRFFCPWSLSKLEEALAGRPFLRTHRSFLLNVQHATGFERQKDKAYVLVSGAGLPAIPVSRSYLGEVRRALGV